jgi:alpha-ketoglutaric semialdehyde dehydrogenase
MSSLNPLVILPGALRERMEGIAEEFANSALMAAGQFCTNPGLTLLVASREVDGFIGAVIQRFETRKPDPLLSRGAGEMLLGSLAKLQDAGAMTLTGQAHVASEDERHPCVPNTLLHATGEQFLSDPEALQTEAFGNVSLFVTADSEEQLLEILATLEGNLTGTIYSAANGEDDALYARVAGVLRPKVGRLLNDRMPTGVELSSAMQHGGPYPATGHAGFTAVGIPASIRRFTVLQSFDHVREGRLPAVLRNRNPGGVWRLVNGEWSKGDVAGVA